MRDLDINEAAGTIAYDLSYDDLEGTVTQSHIHIGQKNIVGGIAIWLCQTPGTAGQAVPAGAFADVLTAIRAGKAYGNVHSTSALGGRFADSSTDGVSGSPPQSAGTRPHCGGSGRSWVRRAAPAWRQAPL